MREVNRLREAGKKAKARNLRRSRSRRTEKIRKKYPGRTDAKEIVGPTQPRFAPAFGVAPVSRAAHCAGCGAPCGRTECRNNPWRAKTKPATAAARLLKARSSVPASSVNVASPAEAAGSGHVKITPLGVGKGLEGRDSPAHRRPLHRRIEVNLARNSAGGARARGLARSPSDKLVRAGRAPPAPAPNRAACRSGSGTGMRILPA